MSRLLILLLITSLSSFGQNTWTQRASFPGMERTGAFYFSINNYGYTGTGEDSAFSLRNDFWMYDPDNDQWIRKADFPGGARKFATAFSMNNKGYAGTGITDTAMMKDFWEYDPAADAWNRIQDLGLYSTSNVLPRRDASSSVNLNLGYVMCGYDGTIGYNKQLFNFDPTRDTMWTKKKNFTGVTDQTVFGRRWGVSFSLNFKVYYGTGYSSSNDCKRDMWAYDPVRDIWSQVADFAGDVRSNATAFTAYNYAYVGGGSNDQMTPDFYRYSWVSNSWSYVANYPLKASNLISFSLNNRFFVGLGNDSLGKPLKEFYEFFPDTTIGIGDDLRSELISVYPTIVSDKVTIDLGDQAATDVVFKAYDLQGKVIAERMLTQPISTVNIHSATGTILYSIRSGKKLVKSGRLIVE